MKVPSFFSLVPLGLVVFVTHCADDPILDSGNGYPVYDGGTVDGGWGSPSDGRGPGSDGGLPGGDSGLPGGDEPEPGGPQDRSCPGYADACTGGLAGAWSFVAVCSRDDSLEGLFSGCRGASAENMSHRAEGTLHLNTNGVFSRQLTVRTRGTVSFPKACVEEATGRNLDMFPCSFIGDFVEKEIEGGSLNCTGQDRCRCTVDIPTKVNDTGTYSAAGRTAVLSPQGGASVGYNFCVARDGVLRLAETSAASPEKALTFVLTR